MHKINLKYKHSPDRVQHFGSLYSSVGEKMDLTGLSKNSQVAPMLVRLYDSHKLYALAKDDKPLARSELSGAICELLDSARNEREGELIADILVSLIRQAEKDFKEALSERLSSMDNVPLRLALHLANDEIQVAEPMLSRSSVLGDLDLIYIIKSKDSEYWRAIAKRESMSDQLVSVLADTRDNATVQILLKNNTIILPERALKIIGEMAQNSEMIARPLLSRKEVDGELATALYKNVGRELQSYIQQRFCIDPKVLAEVVDSTYIEFRDVAASEFTPTSTMLKTAMRQKEKGLLTMAAMLGTLRRAQLQTFIAQFSVYTNIPASQIESALREKEGKTFALICKAFNVLKPDMVTMFLLTNRVRNNVQLVDMNDVSRVVNFYNRADAARAREAFNIKEF